MGKTVTSPSEKWPGTVTLRDLTYPLSIGYEDAIDAANEIPETKHQRRNHTILTGIIPIVEVWSIKGFPETVTPDTFPPAPQMIGWLMTEINQVLREDAEIPNA